MTWENGSTNTQSQCWIINSFTHTYWVPRSVPGICLHKMDILSITCNNQVDVPFGKNFPPTLLNPCHHGSPHLFSRLRNSVFTGCSSVFIQSVDLIVCCISWGTTLSVFTFQPILEKQWNNCNILKLSAVPQAISKLWSSHDTQFPAIIILN